MTPPIYVINLATSTDRWDRIQAELTQHRLCARRVPAVDGRRMTCADMLDAGVSLRTILSLCRPNFRRCHHWTIDNRGAIGCTLSHAKVWHAVAAGDSPYAIVLEDDAHLRLKQGQNIPAPGAYDALLLTAPLGHIAQPGPVATVKKDFTGTTGYAVTRRGAQVLLQHAYPIEQHVDHYMAALAQLGLLRLGTTTRAIVIPNGMPTTISHGMLLVDEVARWRAAAVGAVLVCSVMLLFVLLRQKKNGHW